MPELTVVVPTRGRPHAVRPLVDAFLATSTVDTRLLLVIETDDPQADAYERAVTKAATDLFDAELLRQNGGSMVAALNHAAVLVAGAPDAPGAIGFMGDDHRPRSLGWDRAYVQTLNARPGIVYGDDRIQGERLPTQCAVSAALVRALGHLAPPVLRHLYADNYWLELGRAAGCITYRPDVVIEHLHPAAGTAPWDEGYQRVNAPDADVRDREAYERYRAEHLAADAARLSGLRSGARS